MGELEISFRISESVTGINSVKGWWLGEGDVGGASVLLAGDSKVSCL